MFRHTIPIGRVLGIPIDLDCSWFLIAVLTTWVLAVSYYPAEFKGGTSAEYWLMGALTAVLFVASIVLHELAHSWVAIRYKIPVRRITLFIFGVSSIDPNSELWAAMEKMGRDGINQMPVMLGNNLVGMLSRGDIVKYLQTLKQVGG